MDNNIALTCIATEGGPLLIPLVPFPLIYLRLRSNFTWTLDNFSKNWGECCQNVQKWLLDFAIPSTWVFKVAHRWFWLKCTSTISMSWHKGIDCFSVGSSEILKLSQILLNVLSHTMNACYVLLQCRQQSNPPAESDSSQCSLWMIQLLPYIYWHTVHTLEVGGTHFCLISCSYCFLDVVWPSVEIKILKILETHQHHLF